MMYVHISAKFCNMSAFVGSFGHESSKPGQSCKEYTIGSVSTTVVV